MDDNLVAAVIKFLLSAAGLLAAAALWIKSKTDVGGIKADREKTKISRDKEAEDLRVRIAVLEKSDESTKFRLDKGDERFDPFPVAFDFFQGIFNHFLDPASMFIKDGTHFIGVHTAAQVENRFHFDV